MVAKIEIEVIDVSSYISQYRGNRIIVHIDYLYVEVWFIVVKITVVGVR